MRRITYIISDIDKSIAFEWITEYIDKSEIHLSYILINSEDSYLKNYLEEKKVTVYNLSCKRKQNIPGAVWKCRSILKEIKPDVVHCHLIMANLVGLTAAKLIGIKSRIYTRHHSDYHHVYFPEAVKWDNYCNRLATQIVSISDNVSDILLNRENVPQNKILKILHGFDLKKFSNPDVHKVELLRDQYNNKRKHPVIGVISRAISLKGIQYIIPAYRKLIESYPNALLLLFNAEGDYEEEINRLLFELPDDSYKKISFENDITNLYQVFDLFIHVPISPSVEAFGQTYIEALASGIPLVATKSGIAKEILVDHENAIIVEFKNSEAIHDGMLMILNNLELSKKIVLNGRQLVDKKFQLSSMIQKLQELYLR